MITKYKCPQCGGELSDWWDGENTSSIGEWSDDRFRCEGKLVEAKDDRFGDYVWVNRTKSCGYFGLENLGIKKSNSSPT